MDQVVRSFARGSIGAVASIVLLAQAASAVDNCNFTKTTKTWTLNGSCQTDSTFVIPKNVTVNALNPATLTTNFSVTAVDPAGGNFVGPVFTNTAGQPAHFKNLNIRTNVADTCVGDPNFAGILIDNGASTITNVNITINRNGGNSVCPEGTAIIARKVPASPKGANKNISVKNSTLNNNQLAGFVGIGNINARLTNNIIKNLDGVAGVAQRGIVLRDYAKGTVDFNQVLRNKLVPSDANNPAYGILLDNAGKSTIVSNTVNRNDVGIRVSGSTGATVKYNTVQDSIFDGILVDDANGFAAKTVTVWGNTARKNLNGLHMVSVNGLVQKSLWKSNITQLNREAGISIEGGVLNKIQANTSNTNDIIDISNVGGTNSYTQNVCDTSSGPPVDCP